MSIVSIKNITFYSPENSFCIFKDEHNQVYQGTIFYPYKGQVLDVETDTINTSYGEQFKIKAVKYFLPEINTNMVYFLASGLISKLGEKTASKIISFLQNLNLDLFFNIKHSVEKLDINFKLKNQLEKKLSLYLEFINIHPEFTSKGFTQENIIKVIQLYGQSSLVTLQNNPYEFYKKIPFLTFKFLDDVAQTYQLSRYSPERILAGALAYIDEYCQNYKCSGVPFEILYTKVATFLDIDAESAYSTINHLIDEQKLCEITINNILIISSPQIYFTEKGIANHIKRLNSKSQLNDIYPFEKLPNFLSELQIQAIKAMLNHKVCVLTGMPGSGKTTIIQYAIELFKSVNPKNIIQVGTPTGKAAQRVRESNKFLNVSTNHKLLGFLPTGEFLFNENNLLKVDLLILDETSMVDMFMFYSILKALPTSARLWIIGDTNQLASIALGNVLSDLSHSNQIFHAQLKEVFRQEKTSYILSNAIRVINKEVIFPHSNAKDLDFYFFNKTLEKDIALSTIDLFFKIQKSKNLKLNDIQILCPQKTTLCGVDYLNSQIQHQLFSQEKHIKWKEQLFFQGDKVIQTINDYDKNIFNGDIGYIQSINSHNYEIVVKFEDTEILYEKNEIEQLDLAYAITIHKFQGSESLAILMPISQPFLRMLTPKLLYTAMTRARELLVLNGDLAIFNHAVEHNQDIERQTLLPYFLNE